MSTPGALFPTADTDIVSLHGLQLAAIVGLDCWHRDRPQPIVLTVHLHLAPAYLDTPAHSDDVTDSIHYGHLAKAIQRRVDAKTDLELGYPSAKALAEDVTDAAFTFVRDAADAGKDLGGAQVLYAAHVIVGLPKYIPLAGGFEVELITRSPSASSAGAIVRVSDLILPVLIGVNPPERLEKQRVVTHITFFEAAERRVEEVGASLTYNGADYRVAVQEVATGIEGSSHFTLEKLVYQVIRTAFRACDNQARTRQIEAITVRCQKPSALSFADASGVEMTRTRGGLTI